MRAEGERVAELIDAIVALWEDAEHDHARSGMLLTLRQDLGYNLPSLDERLPSSEELRAALAEGFTAPQPPLARDPEWPDLAQEC